MMWVRILLFELFGSKFGMLSNLAKLMIVFLSFVFKFSEVFFLTVQDYRSTWAAITQ